MDPERRRRLMELGRWHREWQAKHDLDEIELAYGADPDQLRLATPEQEREYWRRADEIMGIDPDTGLRRTQLDDSPLARTDREAQLYMDLRPCLCGETEFDRSGTEVTLPDGGRARRYAAVCPRCGRQREFGFRLPALPLPPDGPVRYGDDRPSDLLDPGEWLLVADRHAGNAPAGAPAGEHAAAAIDEVLKFVPPDAAAVPASAFWSELGESLYLTAPDRFRVDQLVAARDTYRPA